ncbi:hypothetical protein Tco_0986186, partial [Tanacetum coccineum]
MGSDRMSKKRRSSSPQDEGKNKRHKSSDKDSYKKHHKSRKS